MGLHCAIGKRRRGHAGLSRAGRLRKNHAGTWAQLMAGNRKERASASQTRGRESTSEHTIQ